MERNVIEDLVDDCRTNAWECPGKYEFLSSHKDRLERLLKHCQTCSRSVFRVGNYAVIGFQDPDIAGRDGSEILDVLREALLQVFSPYGSLASRAGLGPWLLNYLRTGIGMISDWFNLDSGAPLALAAVIGSDSESGKLFAHILPPMHSLLALLCSERLEEGTLRLLMGFNKHYWEYEEGEERVRLQGDLVLQVIREYDYNSLDGASHNTVSALTVNSVLANVRNLIESRVKARVLERLDSTRLGGGIVEEAIASAVTEALEDMLGDMTSGGKH